MVNKPISQKTAGNAGSSVNDELKSNDAIPVGTVRRRRTERNHYDEDGN